jgi:Primase X
VFSVTDTDQSVIEGLDFILNLLDYQICQWPRTISTKVTQGKQLVVNSRAEAIARFKQANSLDCRISAYPYCRTNNNALPANFIMIDLDGCNFGYDDYALETALRQTLSKVKRLLQYKPTVIWSGNGYHIYIPIDVPIALENIAELSNIDQVSTRFIRFAERYLSDGKSDIAHNNSVSINNCMLRIPGSTNSNLKLKFNSNSKSQATRSLVKVVRKYDECSRPPNINLLIGSFYGYLTQDQIDESRYRNAVAVTIQNNGVTNNGNDNKPIYEWIEKLLHTPISDCRKRCMWKILAPYLINTRKLAYDQAFVIMAGWLQDCNKLHRLDFNAKLKIKDNLNSAIKTGYFPTGLYKLNLADQQLYNLLQNHGVL